MLTPEKLVSYLKLEGLLEELERKTDFELRIQMTLQAIGNAIPLNIKCEQKNSEKSNNIKTQADQLCFKEKGRLNAFLEAWQLYSKSIAIAETSSITLAKAYANRSSILFNLNKYAECIKDIDRAIKLNYPDHLKANLLRRKAKCLKILGKVEADDICEEARIWLEKVNLNDDGKEKLETKIKNITNVEKQTELNTENDNQINYLDMVYNKNIPSASDAIDISYNKNFGKHLVATRDIEAGEILINEKPYASLLKFENAYTHCAHCFVRAWSSIPCEHCIYVMYCSEKCKNEAWKQYHDIECPIKGHLLTMNMNELGVFGLKLTILAVRECGSIEQLRKKIMQIDDSKDYLMKSFTDDGIYCSDKYRPLYNLVTHEADRERYEILTLSLNVAFILYYIFTFTSFFEKISDKNLLNLYTSADAMFIGKLIAHNIMTIQLNDEEFSELYEDGYYKVGFTICSVSSLLNHSCNPNVARCSVLKNNTIQQIFYTLNPITKGSQILTSYCCTFCFTPMSEREQILKHYHFKCNCIACNDIWPLFEELPSVLSIIKDKERKVEVSRAIVRSKQHQRTVFDIGLDKYDGDKVEILKCLSKSISTVYKSTKTPSKEYYELLELFQQTFFEIYGNKFQL